MPAAVDTPAGPTVLFSLKPSEAGKELAQRILSPTAYAVRTSAPEHLHAFYSDLFNALLANMVLDYGSEHVRAELLHTANNLPEHPAPTAAPGRH